MEVSFLSPHKMSYTTRRALLLAGLAAASFSASAEGQMPALVKLIVPYPPGGSVDALARIIQQPLQEQLKTVVVVDNRPGAGGRIAASQVKRDATDGSVILIAPNALTTIQSLVYAGKLDYKVTEDLTPVSLLARYPFSLAVPAGSAAKTVADLVAAMKASQNPSYGTSGAGGMAHFAGLALGKAVGLHWDHIAYKGGAPLVTDLIGGHIPAAVDTLVDQIEHQRSGKIRVLGVFSSKRYPLAPGIPTLQEQGIHVAPVDGWFAAFVPAKTPKNVVALIDTSMAKVLASPEVNAKLNKLVLESAYMPSSELAKLQAQELQEWAPIVRESGFKPD